MIDLSEYTPKKKRWIKDRELVCVYVMGPAEGPVKIGYASDLIARFGVIQGSNWVKITTFSALWCTGGRVAERVEGEVHKRFDASRITGEWFAVEAQQATAAVAEVAKALYPMLLFTTHREIIESMDKKGVEKAIGRPRGRVDAAWQIT